MSAGWWEERYREEGGISTLTIFSVRLSVVMSSLSKSNHETNEIGHEEPPRTNSIQLSHTCYESGEYAPFSAIAIQLSC